MTLQNDSARRMIETLSRQLAVKTSVIIYYVGAENGYTFCYFAIKVFNKLPFSISGLNE
jgi:hypothetical protein